MVNEDWVNYFHLIPPITDFCEEFYKITGVSQNTNEKVRIIFWPELKLNNQLRRHNRNVNNMVRSHYFHHKLNGCKFSNWWPCSEVSISGKLRKKKKEKERKGILRIYLKVKNKCNHKESTQSQKISFIILVIQKISKQDSKYILNSRWQFF